MQFTPPAQGAIVADEGEHVVLTGPINAEVTLSTGEVVDVSNDFVVARDDAHAAEIAHAIGQFWEDDANVHPAQIDVAADGTVTVQPFVYDDSAYRAQLDATDPQGA